MNGKMKKIFSLLLLYGSLFAQGQFKLLTTIHGENNGDSFSSIDAIGDIDGDGYDDFIIGDGGKYVKLYFGGSPFDTLKCIKFLQGERRRVYASCCGKGDLNGDGYNDFVLNTLYDVNDYRVEIYYGGKNKRTYDTPDIAITNNGWYYNFGGRTIEGDINGDGYKDLIISAPNDDYDARGRVYIYYGGKSMDTAVDVYLEGEDHFDMFGYSISVVGDINGDGYDDFLVGAPQLLKGTPGKAYLFYGGPNIGFNNCVRFVGDSTDIQYGKIVSCLCDVNGDGINDFGIVAIKSIKIFSGKTLKKIVGFNHNNSNNDFWFLGKIGDINKDGKDDYTIIDNRINFYFGNTIPDTTSNIYLDYWGNKAINLGNINDDKKNEIAIGRSYGENPVGIVNIYSYCDLDNIKDPPLSILTSDYKIYNNYPNPFNLTTTIKYYLSKDFNITIDILNVNGEKINTLFSGVQSPGLHSIVWNGINSRGQIAVSGIYFVRFTFMPAFSNQIVRQEIIKTLLIK
jgi:hypothetical protein